MSEALRAARTPYAGSARLMPQSRPDAAGSPAFGEEQGALVSRPYTCFAVIALLSSGCGAADAPATQRERGGDDDRSAPRGAAQLERRHERLVAKRAAQRARQRRAR